MHRLVPKFILDQMAEGRQSGKFHAVGLFIDISGFTPLATALMEYSNEGAEVIADVLGALFEPLIDIIYEHGGFVATFAGDAITALFPTDPTVIDSTIIDPTAIDPKVINAKAATDTERIYQHAAVAAWRCNQFIERNANQSTRFGHFTFAVRISIADGIMDWEIWRSAKTQESARWQQRAAYLFTGEALNRCLEADALVSPGDIILTPNIHAQLPPTAGTVEPLATYYRLAALTPQFLDATTPHKQRLLPLKPTLAKEFFPQSLWRRTAGGEFRQVVSMFVNLATLPEGQQGVTFQQDLFAQLARYGGYLCSIGRTGQHDHTCTIILFWGAPAGYENSVARALRFVLDLQQTVPVSMRVGITYHLAYAGYIGSTYRTEYTCYGVHVALATRQMVDAQWGEIVLDDATAAQAHQQFHVTPHGHRQFKGFMEPRSIYLLNGRREQRAEIQDRTPFIGRSREMTELTKWITPLLSKQFGGIVLLTGEPGIGKTRLLREMERVVTTSQAPIPAVQAVSVGATTQRQIHQIQVKVPTTSWPIRPQSSVSPTPVWYHCYTDEILRQPLHPFRDLLRRYFGQLKTQDLSANRQAFMHHFYSLLAATADPELANELTRQQSVLAALIELPWNENAYQQLEPELRLENSFQAIKTLLRAESQRHPLIIQVEDVHWLDRESQLFLTRFGRNMEGYPVLLLLTARPPERLQLRTVGTEPPATLMKIAHSVLPLQSLSKYNMHMLATGWLDSPITQATLDLLQERARGNPFFAEQMLLYWQEQDLLRFGDQGWQFAEDSPILYDDRPSPLSPDIRALLTARLDNLPSVVRSVIQTAAVLGIEFDYHVLAHLLQEAHLSPTHILDNVQRGIWDSVTPTLYRFHHALLCDAAYAMQSRAQVKQMHRKAAAAIMAVHQTDLQPYYAMLVYHYNKGDDEAEELHYAKLTAMYAVQNFLNEDALRYFDRAITLTPPEELTTLHELYGARGAAYQWLGDRQGQWQDIQQQLTIAQTVGNQQWQAEAMLKEADFQRIAGNYAEAVASCQQAVALATSLPALSIQGQACFLWGRILRHQGSYQAAQIQIERALATAYRIDGRPLEADCLYEIGHLYYVQGIYKQAMIYYRRAETIYQRLDNKKGQINCLLVFGAIAYGKGIFGEAERIYQKALTVARTLGWRPGETICLGSLGNTYFDIGDYTTAHHYHAQALAIWQESGDREGEAASMDTLGLIAHHQAELDVAEQYYRGALAIQQELGDQHGEAYTQTHLGHTLLAQQQFTAAMACFEHALAIRQTLGEASSAIDSQVGLALVHWKTDNLSTAMACIEAILNPLARREIDGVEFPTQVYLTCYEILTAAAQEKPACHDRAIAMLREGYRLVQERAAHIDAPQQRTLFLERVPANAKLTALWQQQTVASGQ